jgi:sugar (pentulose or hexulose) kinase
VKYLLGVDFGTGGTKVCLTDADMNQRAYSFREYPILTERADFSEHDPALYWTYTCENIRSCLEQSGVDSRDIEAVAMSAAMPSMVVTDRAGAALGRAINLMDKRAKAEAREVLEKIGADGYFRITSNRLEDHPSIVNLLWIKRHEPERYAKIARVHSIDGYVACLLTGEHNVNCSNAMFFGAYDMRAGRFDEGMIESLGLESSWFPPVTECTRIIGTVTQRAAEDTGLAPGTKVLSGQTDCNAGWLGAGATRPGDIQMNLGTCGNFGIVMDNMDFLPSMINFPYTVPGTYIAVPTTTTGGVLMRYLRDNFSQLEKATEALTGVDAYDLLNREAERVRPGSDGLVVLPYLMGERTPIWDANARGTIFGLTLRHTKGHLVRAMMESVAYALYHSYETLAPHAGSVNFPLVLNEGGAKSALWRRIITDVFNLPTVLVKSRAGAPYGDCLLAGVGAGLIPGFDMIREKTEHIDPMQPDAGTHALYMDYFQVYKRLYAALKDEFAFLAQVNARHR